MKVPPSLLPSQSSPQPSQTDLLMAAALMREQQDAAGGKDSAPASQPRGGKMPKLKAKALG